MTLDLVNNKCTILLYLKNKISEGGKFFKSHMIGKELGISSKQVGSLLYKLSKDPETTKLNITRYARSNSVTWLVEKWNK
jgi:hypothetical protein